MIAVIAASAAAGIIGVLAGQGLVLTSGRRRLALRVAALEQGQTAAELRLDQVSETLPQLISRSEVERAFAQVAQIEAQRAAAQQASRPAPVFATTSTPAELNTAINGQLQALQERVNRINAEFGLG